jgi:threonine dehydrogenase-like Zn-dependent dehydrogenase
VPDEVDDAIASASSCALRTVVQGFDRVGAIDQRETIVIQGSGPLGLFATARAVRSGAAKVIVIGGPERRLALAEQWGASVVIDVASTSAEERLALVRDATGGRGADIVFEVSGATGAFGEGMDMVRSGGRYLVIGHTSELVPFNPGQIMAKHVTIIGSRSANIEHYYRGLQFLATNAGRFRWSDMISSHHDLSGINEAMDGMRSWQEIKPAIDFAA